MEGLDVAGVSHLEPIGAGGFGRVYRGYQADLNRHVAVKVLAQALDDATRRRFRRECRALGALAGHPNVVALYDTGITSTGRPYLVMQYLGGGALAEEVAATGRFDPAAVARIGIRLAGALHTAHAAGVLHRDLKPANVLRSDLGEPVLADFGIAEIGGATTSMSVNATISYASPEVLSGSRATVASDVYSLGSTLYTLLNGRPAFDDEDGSSMAELIGQVLHSRPPSLLDQVPAPLVDVIERAMAKSPDRRIASALELAWAIQDAERACGWPVTPVPVRKGAEPMRVLVPAAAITDRDAADQVRVDGPVAPSVYESPTVATSADTPTGAAATVAEPATVATPAANPTAAAATRPGRRGLVLLSVTTVVLAAAALGIGYGLSQSGSQPGSRPDPAPTTATAAAPAQPTATQAGYQPTEVTVENTCGSDGRSDCELAIRSSPLAGGVTQGAIGEGRTLTVVCQAIGIPVHSSVLDRSSDVWAQLDSGGYVAAIYLDGIDKYTVTTAC